MSLEVVSLLFKDQNLCIEMAHPYLEHLPNGPEGVFASEIQ